MAIKGTRNCDDLWPKIKEMKVLPISVSVIIPSYNHAQFIRKRIESVLEQTYKDYEIIIIDDFSPDNSDEIIRQFVNNPQITYLQNKKNTGTPFSSWIKGASLAKGDYIWICESDDFAEPDYLQHAINAITSLPGAVLYYTNSHIVDENNNIVGNTSEYFDNIWQNPRWMSGFVADGKQELREFQIMGQTVPNMSSALIRKDAFQKACIKYLTKFKLTGDWLFVGLVMQYGKVIFEPSSLNNFRKHSNTARVRVKSALSQAEFILTKYYLYQALGEKDEGLLPLLSKDAIRHVYEPASAKNVILAMLKISKKETIKLSYKLAIQLIKNKEYIKKYKERKEMASKQHIQ